ncbi:MAG TPA: GTP cyclohydrolase MptA [Anaerolineae bacterium]
MLPTHRVYLGLGANLGDRQNNLVQALQYIRSRAKIDQVSGCYETKPVGYLEQPDFLNLACEISTELSPVELLAFLKQIEIRMGREKTFKDGPRPIDIDILFYDDLVLHADGLVIPHPRLHERSFVLVPLAEIAPEMVHPVLKTTVAGLLGRLDRSGVISAGRDLELQPRRDVQETIPEVRLGLTRVGVTGLRRIIRIVRSGTENLFYAEMDLFADLDRDQMGVHMSRFSDVLEEAADEIALQAAPDLETLTERMAVEIVQRQSARRAEASVRAIFPVEKFAPVSGRKTQELYTLLGIAVCTPEQTRHVIGVEAEGMTVCPCAQDMVREHARTRLIEEGYPAATADHILSLIPIASHNQRGRGTLLVGADDAIRAEDLIELVESAMSSETYGRLKRPDEFFVVNKAHHRPRFVEDVVRETLQNVLERFADLPDGAFVSAKQVNFEGIHKHNAFAERFGTFGELRGEVRENRLLTRHTSLHEWLEG